MSLHSVKCTTDMNIHEMVYVANKLTEKECKKLAEALHRKTFQLWKPVTGEHEPNKTCLYLLLKWDRTEGRGKTFIDLAIRLRQIGRPDIATTLSKTVYHEKADALKRKFLDDPFKTMIATESFLLDNPREKIAFGPIEEPKYFTAWDIFWIFSGIFCIIVFVVIASRLLCFGFCIFMWNNYCPGAVIESCDLCYTECSACCNQFIRNYKKYVIGSNASDHTEEDIQSLLEQSIQERENQIALQDRVSSP